jgi:hypothetical protein
MDELVKDLFENIQYMVLGAMFVALLGYAVVTLHPWGRLLIKYGESVWGFWFSKAQRWEKWFLHGVQIAVAVGGFYYLGVTAVVASYWFVEPVRFAILECVNSDKAPLPPPFPYGGRCGEGRTAPPKPAEYGTYAGEVSLSQTLKLPAQYFFRAFEPRPKTWANKAYLKDEAAVDLKNAKQIDGILDAELTFARLLRATAMFAFLGAATSVIKFVIVVATTWLWLPARPWPRGRWYEWLIDEHGNGLRESERESQRGKRLDVAFFRVLIPQASIFLIAAALYLFSMTGYRTVEFEYSSLIKNAAAQKAPESDLIGVLKVEPAPKTQP